MATAIINPAGGDDYTTLATWWIAVRNSGVAQTAQVKGGGSVGIVTLSGGSATPTVEPFSGHMHDGTGFDSAKAHIDVGNGQVGITAAQNATISGIQVRATHASAQWGIYASAGTVTVQNCYVLAVSTNKFGAGIVATEATYTIKNNACQGKMDIGIQCSSSVGATGTIYNNSVVLDSGAAYSGFYFTGAPLSATVKNNFGSAPSSSLGDFYRSGSTITAANNNADTDGTAASSLSSTSDQGSITAADQLVNLTGNMLVKAGADLIDAGADLSGSGVTTDFLGNARSSTPTIGWHEYIPPITEPGAPTFVSATAASSSQIDLAWSTPSSDGGAAITGYRIQRRSPSGSGDWTTIVSDTESTDTSESDTGLTASTNYGYRYAAINSVGVGAYSIEADDTTEAEPEPEATPSSKWTTQSGMAAGLGFD